MRSFHSKVLFAAALALTGGACGGDGNGGTPPGNDPPVAEFSASCTLLACTFTDASTDPDGNDIPYAGAGFDYIAANVVNKSDASPFLQSPPPTKHMVGGIPIGFIGITPEDMPDLVDPDAPAPR